MAPLLKRLLGLLTLIRILYVLIIGTISQSYTSLWSSSSRLRLLLGSLFGILALVKH